MSKKQRITMMVNEDIPLDTAEHHAGASLYDLPGHYSARVVGAIDRTISLAGNSGKTKAEALAKSLPILFLKSHVKQFTRKDGTTVKEHDDKRTKQMQQAPAAKPAAQQEQPQQQAKDPEDVRGSAHGYGTHNVEDGDSLNFKAGAFEGSGKVKSVGKDGAVVEDESGRDHNVHWNEVVGRGGKGNKKPPSEGDKPVAEGDEPPKKEEAKKPPKKES
jgi:hypothetical protein